MYEYKLKFENREQALALMQPFFPPVNNYKYTLHTTPLRVSTNLKGQKCVWIGNSIKRTDPTLNEDGEIVDYNVIVNDDCIIDFFSPTFEIFEDKFIVGCYLHKENEKQIIKQGPTNPIHSITI